MGITQSRYLATGDTIGFECIGPGEGNDPAFRFGVLAYGTAGGVVGEAGPGMTRLLGTYSTFAGVHGTARDVTGTVGTSLNSIGIYGQAGQNPPTDPGWRAGILGASADGMGVIGRSARSFGAFGLSIGTAGVYGMSDSNAGVGAYSTNYVGVTAYSGNSYGIVGTSPTNVGVAGTSANSGPDLPPQFAGNPPGVLGTSLENTGVAGTSRNFPGVIGYGVNAQGVLGISDTSIGVHGRVTTPGGFAGVFDGNVVINGDLAVSGPNKSAVVRFPDGSNRLLYCVESPEPWFEDFGSGKLTRGRATVKLDADFARVIGDYDVFLTPRGDCKGLYVASTRGAAFQVRELGGGKSSVAFSYRIVGRRRDVKGNRRFAKFEMPSPPAAPARKKSRPGKRGGPSLRTIVAGVKKLALATEKLTKTRKRGRAATPRIDPLEEAVKQAARERQAE